MLQHIRANLWLLFLTLLLCSVAYPLALWGIGQTLFPAKAEGSLLMGPDNKVVGSSLIAQSFDGDEFFQPRPSATSGSAYNAMASGGSNLAANNPKLRGRVAQQLGLIVRFRSSAGSGTGPLVGEKVEKWFQANKHRDLAAEWARKNPTLLGVWATSSDLVKDYLKEWEQKRHPNSTDIPQPEDIAPKFFDLEIADSFVKKHPGMWPCTLEKEKDGKKVKVIEPANEGDDIRSIFFDMWLQEHPDADLDPIPADAVMASGSGLDPHITLQNAMYQLNRVAGKWAEKTKRDPVQLRQDIEQWLKEQAAAPLGGLAGVRLINVLEMNLLLTGRLKKG